MILYLIGMRPHLQRLLFGLLLACQLPASAAQLNVTCNGDCTFITEQKSSADQTSPIEVTNVRDNSKLSILVEQDALVIGPARIAKKAIRSIAITNLSDYRLRVHGLPVATNVIYTIDISGNSGEQLSAKFSVTDPATFYKFNKIVKAWLPRVYFQSAWPTLRDCGEVRFAKNRSHSDLPPKAGACSSGDQSPTEEELTYLQLVSQDSTLKR
jgi:hypothetical protein